MAEQSGDEVREQPGLSPDEALALVQFQAGELLKEAGKARAWKMPSAAAGPEELHGALVQARSRLDRLEELLYQAVTLKDSVTSLAFRAEQAAEDAWDDLAKKNRGRGGEYEGAQERYAVWRVQTRALRAPARVYREAADLASSAEHRVRIMHRGMDGVRLDLHRRMGNVPVERSLDRLG